MIEQIQLRRRELFPASECSTMRSLASQDRTWNAPATAASRGRESCRLTQIWIIACAALPCAAFAGDSNVQRGIGGSLSSRGDQPIYGELGCESEVILVNDGSNDSTLIESSNGRGRILE